MGNGRFCVTCDAPLVGLQTKYCTEHGKPKHRLRQYRKKISTRAANSVSLRGGLTKGVAAKLPDDLLSLSGPEILQLNCEATIRNTLLKAKLELEEQKRQIRVLEAERTDPERVLDPETAKRVGRFLAREFDPSRKPYDEKASGGTPT